MRPLRESGIRSLGTWLINHSWNDVYLSDNPSNKCKLFFSSLRTNVDKHLPVKSISLHQNDKPWMNCNVKSLILQRQRAWHSNDQALWRYLRNKVTLAIRKAKKDFYNKRVRKLKTQNPANWYRQIKLLTNGPQDQPTISIPGLPTDNGDNLKEAANYINDYFLQIASDIPHLNRDLLPAYLPSPSKCPIVQPYHLYKLLS